MLAAQYVVRSWALQRMKNQGLKGHQERIQESGFKQKMQAHNKHAHLRVDHQVSRIRTIAHKHHLTRASKSRCRYYSS